LGGKQMSGTRLVPAVNPEIAKVLRKQTKAERQKLEALILRDGIQDPIVVWQETGEILDGHNRVEIASGANAHGEILDYAIEEVSLPDLDTAIEYVLERQEGKRNATPQDLAYSRGKLYERRKKPLGTNRHNAEPEDKGAQNAHPRPEGKAAEDVGQDSGVDAATVRRDAEYSRAVDALTEVFGKDFQAHVLSGESKLSKSDVVMLAGELGKDDALLYSAAELWAFGKAGTFKLAHLLARIRTECGPKTHAALWQPTDEDARVRESAPQLTHLLKLAGNEDEVTADLVEIVESGQPNPASGKRIKSVQEAHKLRQKEREPKESDADKAWSNFAAIMKKLHELAAGVDAAGGIHQILGRQPEQNQRIFVRDYRALAERALRQVEEFEQRKEVI
jgi:hypothetical protein